MKEILEILNPVHLPTCDEWVKIAELIIDKRFTTIRTGYEAVRDYNTIKLQSRFEKLVRGELCNCDCSTVCPNGKVGSQPRCLLPALLTKERFVCEVEKPEPLNIETRKSFVTTDEMSDHRKYNNAKSNVWFEGFEKVETPFKEEYVVRNGVLDLCFNREVGLTIFLNSSSSNKIFYKPTVFDFIIELDRYNRTAKEPIKIMWTEAFVTQLLND